MVVGQTQKLIPGKSLTFFSLSNPWDTLISWFFTSWWCFEAGLTVLLLEESYFLWPICPCLCTVLVPAGEKCEGMAKNSQRCRREFCLFQHWGHICYKTDVLMWYVWVDLPLCWRWKALSVLESFPVRVWWCARLLRIPKYSRNNPSKTKLKVAFTLVSELNWLSFQADSHQNQLIGEDKSEKH